MAVERLQLVSKFWHLHICSISEISQTVIRDLHWSRFCSGVWRMPCFSSNLNLCLANTKVLWSEIYQVSIWQYVFLVKWVIRMFWLYLLSAISWLKVITKYQTQFIEYLWFSATYVRVYNHEMRRSWYPHTLVTFLESFQPTRECTSKIKILLSTHILMDQLLFG